MQFTGCHKPVQLIGWDIANNMGNVTCADTQTSNVLPYTVYSCTVSRGSTLLQEKFWFNFLSSETPFPSWYLPTRSGLLKTASNNIVLPIFLNVVNNIVQQCYTWWQANSESRILNNIVNKIEQCWRQNIVQCYLQQPWTGCVFFAEEDTNFWAN